MSHETLQEVIIWLNDQIAYANETIQEANQARNFGRESQYQGVRDAMMRCLNKLKTGE